MTIALKPWQRRLAYAVFALAAFLVAFHFTFPADAVTERLSAEAAAAGWTLHAADSEPAGLAGVRMTGVTLQRGQGARLGVDVLRAKLRLLPLLLGRRGVDFDARLFDGSIAGSAEVSRASRHVAAEVSGVELGRAPALREIIGVPLAGVVKADVDLTLDQREPAKSSGHVDLSIDNAAVQAGPIPIPGMAAGLTIPRVRLGTFVAHAEVKDGRAVFQRLEAKGGDLQVSGQDFYVSMQPRLDQAAVYGKAQLSVSPGFWSSPEGTKLKPIADVALASARGPDGSYGLQVYGTVARPLVRLAQPGAAGPAPR